MRRRLSQRKVLERALEIERLAPDPLLVDRLARDADVADDEIPRGALPRVEEAADLGEPHRDRRVGDDRGAHDLSRIGVDSRRYVHGDDRELALVDGLDHRGVFIPHRLVEPGPEERVDDEVRILERLARELLPAGDVEKYLDHLRAAAERSEPRVILGRVRGKLLGRVQVMKDYLRSLFREKPRDDETVPGVVSAPEEYRRGEGIERREGRFDLLENALPGSLHEGHPGDEAADRRLVDPAHFRSGHDLHTNVPFIAFRFC